MSVINIEYEITTNEDAYKIIKLYQNGVECAKMSLRLIVNNDGIQQLNISSIERYCPSLKGICFPKFMEILVTTIENKKLFGFALKPKIEVALFVSPYKPDGETQNDFYDETAATEKLTRLYNKYGFRNDEKNISSYLISRLDIIKKVAFNGVTVVNSPYKTPNDSPNVISPIRPKKTRSAKSVDLKPTNLFSQLTKAIPPKRYMSTTVSSRAKKRKGGTRKNK